MGPKYRPVSAPSLAHCEIVVLLDDARPVPGAMAYLYRDPVEVVAATRIEEVLPALQQLRAAGARGLHAAGYLTYEAGAAFEPALADRIVHPPAGDGAPLLWFGLFADVEHLPAAQVPDLLPPPDDDVLAAAAPLRSAEVHRAAVARVLEHIRAGDIYQANVALDLQVAVPPDPLALYAALRPRAAMGHGALIRHDGRSILSFSPESFFRLDGRRVETRPMKGTAPRLADPSADTAAAYALAADAKQRAENLMIVDLLRNDLSRVCTPGSVTVPELFAVESYPTVHQMVSRVEGRLRPGADAVDLIAALFPCGSITGAPKLRAMEVIRLLEGRPRGIYTGSIGSIDPSGDARFNVAIRTISVDMGGGHGQMGVGSGIVADSLPEAEWAECLAKARFLERDGD